MTIGSIPLCLLSLAITAIASALLVYLFLSLRNIVLQMKKSLGEEYHSLCQRCDAFEKALAGMESMIHEAEARAAVLVPPPTSRSGMNMNKRLQAARMSKRGERPEQIAAALGLPASEVALLLKVQRLTLPN